MNELQLGEEIVSFKDILEGSVKAFHEQFMGALEFCRLWLSGQELFQVQTSGSTGKPKTILLSREQMIMSAGLTAAKLGIKKNDRALVCINVEYIGGIMMLVRGLHLGLRLQITEPDSDPLRNIPEEQLPDLMAVVPMQLDKLLEANAAKLNKVRNVIVGSAPISEASLEKCRSLSNRVYHSYGMTETCSHFALKLISTEHAEEHFYPLPGYRISEDERGCLCVQGPVTKMEKLCTNDLVRLYPDHSFDIAGRIDNVVNSGGVKLSPELLEARLSEKIRGLAFFFAGLPDERLGQKLVLLVEGNESSEKELESAWSDWGPYEKPKEIHYLRSFIYTQSGKLDRNASLEKLAITK